MDGVTGKTQAEMDDWKEKEAIKKIEAVLFVSGRFLEMKDLVMLSDMNPIIIREAMDKLRESYDEANSSLQVVERNGAWKMDVRPEFSHLSTKMATGSSEFSKAEQGTLALVAYKQPIKQSVIIKIRGNKAYDHLKRFAELGLIKKKRQGHTWELSLSDEFYDYFGVAPGGKLEGENFVEARESEEDTVNVLNSDDAVK